MAPRRCAPVTVTRLLELGPAHTRGDVIVHVPDAGIVFTGDLVFHGGHPIVWAGPVANWLAACDALLALDAAVVVPGHGAVSDRRCIEDQRGYFEWLVAEGNALAFDGGMTPMDAARDLAGGPYAGWGEGERLVVNLTALARDHGLAPRRRRPHPLRLDGRARGLVQGAGGGTAGGVGGGGGRRAAPGRAPRRQEVGR